MNCRTFSQNSLTRGKSHTQSHAVMDNKLSRKQNIKYIIKKAHSRLYCLRKLRSFNVGTELPHMFYTSTMSCVLTFGSVCRGENAAKQDKKKKKPVEKAEGNVCRKQESFHPAYHRRLTDRPDTNLADKTFPLWPEFASRRIDRSGRFRDPYARTTRYKIYFIPSSIQTLNQLVKREWTFHHHPGCNFTTTILYATVLALM